MIITYCKNCKYVIKQFHNQPWLCRDSGKTNTLGIVIHFTCESVNDDYKCSRFVPKLIFKLLKRIKHEKI